MPAYRFIVDINGRDSDDAEATLKALLTETDVQIFDALRVVHFEQHTGDAESKLDQVRDLVREMGPPLPAPGVQSIGKRVHRALWELLDLGADTTENGGE